MKKQLLAPNGKTSNLNAKQYKIVRSPEFISWFGDWENQYKSTLIKIVDGKLIYDGVDVGIFEITNKSDRVEIDRLYIDKEFQKKGIGKACIQYLFNNYNIKLIELYPHPYTQSFWLNNGVFNVREDGFFEIDNKKYSVSKVVDENGEPLVVYHGTNTDFSIFEGKKAYYFAVDKKYSDFVIDNYRGRKEMSKVLECFLSINKINKVRFPIETNNVALFLNENKGIIDKKEGLFGRDDIDKEFQKEIESKKIDLSVYVCLNSNQIKLADGTNTTFDANNDDIRYAGGGELGVDNFKKMKYNELMLYIKDSYKELGAEIGIKGHTEDGEPIIGYLPYQNEYMYKSDSTGKNIRFYIDLGNEKYIHPSEVNPKFNVSEQKRIEQKADYFAKISNKEYNKIISELEKNNELNLIVDTLEKALKTFNIENQYDSSDIFKSYGNSTLESKDGNKRRMKFDVYYFRVNDSELKTNVKNLDLERFNNEYLKKYEFKNGGRTIAQTPAPKNERIYGSDTNKEKSSESNTSAKQIVFDENTIKSIKNKVDKHNKENPDKLISIESAKAVVRRGMGAYSSSRRPTIKGGKPNSRVAWGLARLNAFIYKVKNGVSKSGKYTQDDDLIKELDSMYSLGGKVNILSNIWMWFGIKF